MKSEILRAANLPLTAELFGRRQALRLALVGVAALGFTAATGCAVTNPEPVPSDDDAKDVAAVVYVGENFYDPELVSIKPGQAVRWEWIGRDKHDVVANDRSFVSVLQVEGSYTHIFNEVGDYGYICSIHPEMRGVVEVIG